MSNFAECDGEWLARRVKPHAMATPGRSYCSTSVDPRAAGLASPRCGPRVPEGSRGWSAWSVPGLAFGTPPPDSAKSGGERYVQTKTARDRHGPARNMRTGHHLGRPGDPAPFRPDGPNLHLPL